MRRLAFRFGHFLFYHFLCVTIFDSILSLTLRALRLYTISYIKNSTRLNSMWILYTYIGMYMLGMPNHQCTTPFKRERAHFRLKTISINCSTGIMSVATEQKACENASCSFAVCSSNVRNHCDWIDWFSQLRCCENKQRVALSMNWFYLKVLNYGIFKWTNSIYIHSFEHNFRKHQFGKAWDTILGRLPIILSLKTIHDCVISEHWIN